ncbi:GreA/GreB family transcription elongation factor [Vibrio sp. ES.051]|uniref:GreA/GreB family elongation factor n=1 Tax=Vibrio sp. ES.051 TaxID=1761909 RepID=UPI000BF99621|nr:GreA/GreB family elongation factor [Vibrio sp. ES.051]PFG45735.1 GreA/GreB family transcription elongation factor [Vibrio sp. ES.051]
MFERWFSVCCLALRTWWLTSRFFTYQSPLRLLLLFEAYERQARCRNLARIVVGDMVRFMDIERSYQYRMTLVDSRKSEPLMGMLAVDSYLGANLLGRAQNDRFEIEIFNQRRCFVITEIVHQSQPPAQQLLCSCMLCQSIEVKS